MTLYCFMSRWDKYQAYMCRTRQDRFVWISAKAGPMRCPVATTLRFLMNLPGVDIEDCNWEGHTALSLCILRDHKRGECSTGAITWLVSKGANIQDYSRGLTTHGYTMNPLLYSSLKHDEAHIYLLVNMGAPVNMVTSGGEAPIHLCVRAKHWNMPQGRGHYSEMRITAGVIDLLIEAGADINRRMNRYHANNPGYAPLLCAIDEGNEFAGLYLLCHNCDPSGGYTGRSLLPSFNPLSLALERRLYNLALILVMLGCPLKGLEQNAAAQAPAWVRDRLTRPQSLKDLSLASVRWGLRHGPHRVGGRGSGTKGLHGQIDGCKGNGFRVFEEVVRFLPLPMSLKRRVIMVGLRKLVREKDASFCSRGDRFILTDGFLQSTSTAAFDCHFDDDDDDFYDDIIFM